MPALTLRDEATVVLQGLLRLDTVNPPGNETQAAELLRNYLEPLGVTCELYARAPERANLDLTARAILDPHVPTDRGPRARSSFAGVLPRGARGRAGRR